MSDPLPLDRLLDVKTVAQRLGIGRRTVWTLAGAGQLPAPLKLGRSVRWRESDVAAFIAAGCDMQRLEEASR